MSHKHSVIDTDKHFIIDAVTREVSNSTETKNTLFQYDHNSEQFTFELQKIIDGHDMTDCNSVQIHYINIDVKTKETRSGIYEVNDVKVSADNPEIITFSWLVSRNATQLVGSLNFIVRFACVSEEGQMEYVWSTAIHSNVYIASSISNTEVVIEEYADILASWESRIFNTETNVSVIEETIKRHESRITNLESQGGNSDYVVRDELIGAIAASKLTVVSAYNDQEFTDAQKETARNNIGAISQAELDEVVGSVEEQLENKQDALVSGINIKTINGKSLLGDGDINIEGDQSGSTPDDVINLRSEIEKAIGTYIIPSEPEIVDTPRIDNKYYHVNTGEIVDGTFFGSQCTELIAVTEGDIYYITGEYGYLCALITEFDENKTYISSVGVNSNGRLIATDYEYIVPSGVAYVGFSTRSITNQALIVKVSFDSEVEFADVKGDIVNIKADIAKLENDVSNMENNSNIETIESLKADVQDIKTWGIASKNLYNPENDTFGNRADGSGNVSMGIRNSEWITVEPNSSYVLSNHGALGVVVNIALKDNDDSVISLGNNQIDSFGDYLITTEESTTHIRFSTYVPESNGLLSELMLEKGVRRTEYEPYKIILDYVNRLPKSMQNVWIGKKMAVDGDSITHDFDRNYWQFAVSKILGMWLDDKRKLSTEDNLFAGAEGYAGCGWRGIGGSTIADSYLLNAVYLNDLTLDIGSLTEEQIAEYEATYKTNEGDNYDRHRADTGIVLRYQNYPDDADIVLIAGGTNDWAHSVTKLGDFDSDDITTFNGALNTLLPGLKEKYPDIPIVMMTPIKRGTYGYVNKLGLTQEDFVDALIKKCRQYNVYCLDMWANCPINPNIKSMVNKFYTRPAANGGLDLVHPNAEGHLVMGKTVSGFIRTLD